MPKIINRNYGSIPHLSTSKLTQQADKKIEAGQERILTKKTRDKHDFIIVTEKLDGSNVGIYRRGNELIPLTRAGYHALTSPYPMHHEFAIWLKANGQRFDHLPDGWRICGEWMWQAHGTIYYPRKSEEPFVPFDIIDRTNERVNYDLFSKMISDVIEPVPVIAYGNAISVEDALYLLGDGIWGQPEKPEGVVYRCERKGQFDFAAKWVRADKEDGKYLDQNILHFKSSAGTREEEQHTH